MKSWVGDIFLQRIDGPFIMARRSSLYYTMNLTLKSRAGERGADARLLVAYLALSCLKLAAQKG